MRIFERSIDGMLKKLGLKEMSQLIIRGLIKLWKELKRKLKVEILILENLIKFDDVMNDQRQVIFSQRLKILKEEKIDEKIKDFFNEILLNLNMIRSNFQKSGDEKNFLSEIKNITGNVISDDEILKFGKLKENEFSEKIQNLYSAKKSSRIEILGQNQNNSLEKKIFLQIIDCGDTLAIFRTIKASHWIEAIRAKDPFEFKKRHCFI